MSGRPINRTLREAREDGAPDVAVHTRKDPRAGGHAVHEGINSFGELPAESGPS